MPVYGDLLEPEPPQPAGPGGPQIPQQRMGPGGGLPPAEPSSPAGTGTAGPGEDEGGARPRLAEVGFGVVAEDEPGKSGPSVAVIVGLVLVGATVLVLGALAIPFLLERLGSSDDSPSYSIGDCVVQAGDSPEPADCGDPGAYEIVAQVESQEQCDDPTQPAIEVEGPPVQFFCLAPMAGAEPEPEPSG